MTRTKPTHDDLSVREDWLIAAVEMLRPFFAETEYPLPPEIHISVGFPLASSRGENLNIRAQTIASWAADDGKSSVFVSPFEGDTATVVLILVHELIHVALDNADGHRGRFAKMAKQLGLEAPLLSLQASVKLTEQAALIAQWLGPYPHIQMDMLAKILAGEIAGEAKPGSGGPISTVPPSRWGSGPKRQTSRLLKAWCPKPVRVKGSNKYDSCNYTVRVTRKWVDIAVPTCPIHGHAMTVEA